VQHHSWLKSCFSALHSLSTDADAVEKMKWRMQTPDGRKLYARRKSTVEPVFGIIQFPRSKSGELDMSGGKPLLLSRFIPGLKAGEFTADILKLLWDFVNFCFVVCKQFRENGH
jgi:hypothetical protein